MRVSIENFSPMEGTYVCQKSKPSGFGRSVELPPSKVKDILKAQEEFYKHQAFLRKIFKETPKQ